MQSISLERGQNTGERGLSRRYLLKLTLLVNGLLQSHKEDKEAASQNFQLSINETHRVIYTTVADQTNLATLERKYQDAD